MEIGESIFLAEEIYEKILAYLDAISMMKAMRTCRLWYRIISDQTDVWLRSCLSDISPGILTDLTGIKEIPKQRETILYHLFQKLPWLFWREIYKEYYRCCNIAKRKSSLTNISYYIGHGAVTSLAFKDGAVYSGHEGGMVFRWDDIDVGVNSKIVHCCEKKRAVTDLFVTETDDDTISCLLSGKKKQIVVTISDYGLCVTHEDGKSRCKNMGLGSFVGYCGKSFLLHGNRSSLVYETYNSKLECTRKIRLQKRGSDLITALAAQGNIVLWGDENSCLNKYTINLNREEGQYSFLARFDGPVRQIFMKGDNWICVTGDSEIHISVQGEPFVSHDFYSVFNRSLESADWHGALLALGSKYGFVNVYLVQNDDALRNFSLTNCTQVKLQALHINRLSVGDDGTRPVVVAATDEPYITVIRW